MNDDRHLRSICSEIRITLGAHLHLLSDVLLRILRNLNATHRRFRSLWKVHCTLFFFGCYGPQASRFEVGQRENTQILSFILETRISLACQLPSNGAALPMI